MVFALALATWLLMGLLVIGACYIGSRASVPEPRPEPVPASAAQPRRLAA